MVRSMLIQINAGQKMMHARVHSALGLSRRDALSTVQRASGSNARSALYSRQSNAARM